MKTIKIAATGLAVAALLAATPGMAQDSGRGLINRLLAQAQTHLATLGDLTLVAELSGSLSDGESRGDIVRLPSRGTYVVVGVCDEDCTDFDLAVRDTNANEIGADREDDDFPIVSLEGVSGGVYQIQSEMPGCSVNPCLTGVRVYRVD